MYSSAFIRTVTERGYMHQSTALRSLDEVMAERMIPAYIGFDCTADSLHVGSLVQIMMLRLLQQTGHKPIVLMVAAPRKSATRQARTASAPCFLIRTSKATRTGSRRSLKNT